MFKSVIKFLAASAAFAAVGAASTTVSSGERAEGEIVVASLVILPGEDIERPLGVARSVSIDESSPLDVPAVDGGVISAAETGGTEDRVASLDESEAFARYRALNGLDAVPVPTPRPRVAVQAPRVAPAVQRVRPQARPQTVRVAQGDAPRKRVLRVNPVMIGVYR